MIKLQSANLIDIPTIFHLAEEIWYDHYPGIVTIEQIKYMLTTFYSPKVLEKLMDEGQEFYLILNREEQSIGYMALTEKEEGNWFMNKFYIKTYLQAEGIGTKVLKIWESANNPKKLELQVNRKNYKSINFYFKNGFKITQAADFDIGNGYSMDDFVMTKMY